MNIDPRDTLQGCDVFDTFAWNGKNVQLCQGWRSFISRGELVHRSLEFFVPILSNGRKRTKKIDRIKGELLLKLLLKIKFDQIFSPHLLNTAKRVVVSTRIYHRHAYGLKGNPPCIDFPLGRIHVHACTQARPILGWVDFSLLGRQTVWQLRYPFAPGYLHWQPSQRVATLPFR